MSNTCCFCGGEIPTPGEYHYWCYREQVKGATRLAFDLAEPPTWLANGELDDTYEPQEACGHNAY